jgi:rhodanese-related sulfurtransferase
MVDPDPHIRRTVIFSLVTIAVLLVIVFAPFTLPPSSISVGGAYELLERDSSVVVLDVRTEEEFTGSTGRLPRALLIPVQDLEKRIGELSPYKERTILVYCRSGRRSRNGTALLEKYEFNAMNIEGGILEWTNSGFPVFLENKP